jgi:hypothetical protein
MAWIAAPDTVTAGTAQAAIPFRTDMPVSAASIAFSVSIALLALILLVAVLVYARRRGWNGRWPSGMISAKQAEPAESIEVCATRRVSMATTAHVVLYRGREYLLVESTRGVTASITWLGSSEVRTGEEP